MRTRRLSRAHYDEWTPERAEEIASSIGLRLRAEHWRVLMSARELWVTTRRPLDVALLAARVDLPTTTLAALFPPPLRQTLRALAGIEE